MHRIEAPGATVDHKFTEGDPQTGVQPTEVADDWLNAVQEELVTVIVAAGLTLKTAATETSNQLLAAIAALRTAAFSGSNQLTSVSGYQKLPGNVVLQWGVASVAASSTATLSYPIAFPNNALCIVGSRRIGSAAVYNFQTFSASQYQAANTAPSTESANWIAIGY
jgi:hypothetical protein